MNAVELTTKEALGLFFSFMMHHTNINKEVSMKKKKILIGILYASLLLSACSSEKNSNDNFSGMAAYDEMPVMETAAKSDFAVKNSIASGASQSENYEEMGTMDSKVEEGGITDANVVKGSRKLIRNISIDMETIGFDETIQTITKKTDILGGYVESSGISGSSLQSDRENYETSEGFYRTANMRVRIPQDKLDEFLETAESSGNITYKNENVSDITLQYADTKDHIKTLEIEQERLWELLEKADSIETVIALEERLSEIRYDLESYQTRLKSYDNQVDYSTVYISISEVRIYTATQKESMATRIGNGFKKNVRFLLNMSENVIVWVFSHIITLGILGMLGFFGYKKLMILIRKKKNIKEEKKERKIFFHNDH